MVINGGIDIQAGLCAVLAVIAAISKKNTELVVLVLSCPVCYWQSRCFGTHLMMKFRISFEWLIGKVSTLVIKVTLLGRVMEGLYNPVGLGITLSPGL